MVWQTFRWLLAADDLLDLYFHFRYDLEVWKEEDQTRSFAEFLGPGNYCCYMAYHAAADGLVWNFKFSGMRLLAGNSFGKDFKENPCCIWLDKRSFWLFPFSKYQQRLFGNGGIRMDFPSPVVV